MNNFFIDPDFHVGFIIGTIIYIGALYIYKKKIKKRNKDMVYYYE